VLRRKRHYIYNIKKHLVNKKAPPEPLSNYFYTVLRRKRHYLYDIKKPFVYKKASPEPLSNYFYTEKTLHTIEALSL
jgi:hypothetical protein